MTEGEICRQYRSAQDRASQLQILADLNCVPRLEIIKILMHNGEQVRLSLAVKGKKRTTELTDEELALTVMCPADITGGDTKCDQYHNCRKCTLDWLQRESEE